MRLRALLDSSAGPRLPGLRLLSGEDELNRSVRGVMTTDLRDPSRYLSGGELVLTGLAWRRTPEDSEPFVRILADAGVAGLAAGEAETGPVPEDLIAACTRHRLPLFAVSEDLAFAAITEHVVRQVSNERAGDLAAVVDRHRRLVSPDLVGGGPEAVLDLLGSDLDLRAWVLSPIGRLIAGPVTGGIGRRSARSADAGSGQPAQSGDTGTQSAGPGGTDTRTTQPSITDTLSPELRARLVGGHLAAARSGRPGPHRIAADGTVHSLFPIRSGGRDRGGPGDLRVAALSDWLLAVEADAGEWPEERHDLLHGVTQLIAVERDRRHAARTVRRRLAQDVLELVQSGAPSAEIAARLRVAAPVLLPALDGAPHWQVVVARVEPDGADFPGGPVARALLEEILATPRAATGPEPYDCEPYAEHTAVALTGDEAVALIPLSPTTGVPRRPGEPGEPMATPPADPGTPPVITEPARSPEPGAPRPITEPTKPGRPSTHDAPGHAPARLSAAHGRKETTTLVPSAVHQALDALVRGLTDGAARLTLGLSAVVHSAEGLRGALEEARHARHVAAARPGRVCAAGHDELASHVLLLPFVPDDVRRAFTARLLEPLHAYDRRHRTGLMPTLEAFLDCDGSWTRCAARLHLHVNTLRYRVRRIEQLTGRDLSRLEDKLDFFLALRMS